MADDGTRFIDDDMSGHRFVDSNDDGHRFGYQPKTPKKIEEGYKPKDNPLPSNPPKGKKSKDDK